MKSHSQRVGSTFGMAALKFGGAVTFNCPAFKLTQVGGPAQSAKGAGVPIESGWLGATLGGAVHLAWKPQPGSGTLLLTVTGLVKAPWLSIAFGKGMVGADALVGWLDTGTGKVNVHEYTMTSLAASGVTPIVEDTKGMLVGGQSQGQGTTQARIVDGFVSFTVTLEDPRFLSGSVPMIWAHGESWQRTPVTANSHSSQGRSGAHTGINFQDGTVTEASIDAKLVAHGVLMALAWAVLVPLGICFARFRADVAGVSWIKAHRSSTSLAGLLVAVSVAIVIAWVYDTGREDRFCTTAHGKVGMTGLVLLAVQITTAVLRPGKGSSESPVAERRTRRAWEIGHRVCAVLSTVISIAALFTGLQEMQFFGVDDTGVYQISLVIWLAVGTAIALAREFIVSAAVAACDKDIASDCIMMQPAGVNPQTGVGGEGDAASVAPVLFMEVVQDQGEGGVVLPEQKRVPATWCSPRCYWTCSGVLMGLLFFIIMLWSAAIPRAHCLSRSVVACPAHGCITIKSVPVSCSFSLGSPVLFLCTLTSKHSL